MYKVGDEVLVKGIFKDIHDTKVLISLENGISLYFLESEIVGLALPTPKPIAVGDCVKITTYPYGENYMVQAINDGQAWLRHRDGDYRTVNVKFLIPIVPYNDFVKDNKILRKDYRINIDTLKQTY